MRGGEGAAREGREGADMGGKGDLKVKRGRRVGRKRSDERRSHTRVDEVRQRRRSHARVDEGKEREAEVRCARLRLRVGREGRKP